MTALATLAETPAVTRPLIAISGVTKRFGNGTLALDRVDLSIAEGEFVSLLGPSGCGKSTLLRLISGLSAPSEGIIDWPRSAYDAWGRPLPELGYVFQEPTLMPWATVFENVYLPLRVARIARGEATPRVTEALESVGLGGFAGSYPRQLSGGMKMRVSIARALVVRPKVLLMDEPFAALDEITRFRLNDDLLALYQRERLTVIFVTHSVFESVYLSSRIVVMSARPGRIATDVAVPVPFPRDEGFRLSRPYADLCGSISASLHGAMGQPASGVVS